MCGLNCSDSESEVWAIRYSLIILADQLSPSQWWLWSVELVNGPDFISCGLSVFTSLSPGQIVLHKVESRLPAMW